MVIWGSIRSKLKASFAKMFTACENDKFYDYLTPETQAFMFILF